MKCCTGVHVRDVYADTTLTISTKPQVSNLTIPKPQASNFHFQHDAEPVLKKFLRRIFWARSASKVENVKLVGISVVSDKSKNESVRGEESVGKVADRASHDATTCSIFAEALLFTGVLFLFAGFGYLNYVIE